jgi:hypothetical protein
LNHDLLQVGIDEFALCCSAAVQEVTHHQLQVFNFLLRLILNQRDISERRLLDWRATLVVGQFEEIFE